MQQEIGRFLDSNCYGGATKPIQVPALQAAEIKNFLAQQESNYLLPLFLSAVSAGFPSPADDYIEKSLDLNSHLIKHPAATFFVIASGDSMKNAGIHSGDLLIVDKSLTASHGKIVIAAINGELTVKRLFCQHGKIQLHPENDHYEIIAISDEQDLIIWGVVTHIIHQAA